MGIIYSISSAYDLIDFLDIFSFISLIDGKIISFIWFSDKETEAKSQDAENGGLQLLLTDGKEKLNCCADCSAEFDAEARCLQINTCITEPTLSSLPPWLRNEGRRLNSNDQVIIFSN